MKNKTIRYIHIVVLAVLFFLLGELCFAYIPALRSFNFNHKVESCYWNIEEHTSLIHDFSQRTFIFDKKNMGEIKKGSRKYSIDHDDNTLRIVCLGSSSTVGLEPVEGKGNEFHYPLYLETLFKKSGNDVEVINGGIGGVGFYPLLVYFKDVLVHLDPNLVVVYFGGNGDRLEYVDYYRRAQETLKKFPHINNNRDLIAAMDFKFHSRELLNMYIVLINHSRIFYTIKRLADSIKDRFKKNILIDENKVLRNHIDELINMCVSKNIGVILIPEICINTSSMHTLVFVEGPYAEIFYDLADKYSDSNIYYLRLHEELAREITRPQQYFADGQHMTKKGYTWLATEIYKFIHSTMAIEGSNVIYTH